MAEINRSIVENRIAPPPQTRQPMAEAAQERPQSEARTRQVRFTKKKETPGCVVFQEVEEEGQFPTIGTLYVKKWFAGSAQSIRVTISKE